MTTATVTRQNGAPGDAVLARRELPVVRDELEDLWAMSPAQRVAAMWRGELTRRQLSKWTSGAQHEVPLLGGEFAWIAMWTPEWAEASQHANVGCTATSDQDADQ